MPIGHCEVSPLKAIGLPLGLEDLLRSAGIR